MEEPNLTQKCTWKGLSLSATVFKDQLESSATAKTCFGSFHSYQVSKFRAQKYLVVSHNFQWPCMGPPSMLNDGKASALRCTLRCIISSVKPPQTVVKSVWYNELCLRSTTMSAWLTSHHHRPHQTTWLILAWLALWHHVTRIPTFGASRPRATIRCNFWLSIGLHSTDGAWPITHLHTCTLAHTHKRTHTHTNQQTNKPTNQQTHTHTHTNHKSYIQLMANNTLAHAHEQFSASFWPGTNISLNFLDCKINRLCRTTVFCPLAPVFCHFWTVIYWSVS